MCEAPKYGVSSNAIQTGDTPLTLALSRIGEREKQGGASDWGEGETKGGPPLLVRGTGWKAVRERFLARLAH